MPTQTMQLGRLIGAGYSPEEVRAEAEAIAARTPTDPRIAAILDVIDAVNVHNRNAAIARDLWGKIEGQNQREGYEYVRATLQELNDRLAVARGRLIKPYADLQTMLTEAHEAGYITSAELATMRESIPGGLGALPLLGIVAVVALAGASVTATWIALRPRMIEAKARADATRHVAEQAVAVFLDAGSSPAQQQAAADLLKDIVQQPGGPLATVSFGIGSGLLIAAGIAIFLLTRAPRRS